jgi:hypothetical protein
LRGETNRMKQYSLRTSESFIFKGLSGNIYSFVKGQVYGALTLGDEMTMDSYCLPQNGSILKRVDADAPVAPKPSNVISIKDILPNYETSEPQPIKFAKSDEDVKAELAIAKSKEKIEEIANDVEKNRVSTYLYSEALETVNSAVEAVTEFLASDDTELSWDEKARYVRAFIAEDPRKTLHSKVDELLAPKE